VAPLAERGRLEAVRGGFRISDRVEVRAVPGHTPGSTAVIVHGRETAVLSGDLIHHPHQFAHPMTCSRFCVDRAASARGRRSVLEWVAGHGAVLMPAHFGWGRVEREGGRFRFRPIPR
jgi:glyoxylase-like metal-dependent hydrolase (beta-lactamase superfamily II)